MIIYDGVIHFVCVKCDLIYIHLVLLLKFCVQK